MITACMIVKNEEGRVGPSLDSILPMVDHVVIADTGSTDGTVEEIRSRGVLPLIIPWEDDFSSARNHVLSYVKSGWVLSVDGDEVITERHAGALREAVDSGDADAYILEKRSYVGTPGGLSYRKCSGEFREERSYPGYLLEPNDLLFRVSPGVAWESVVHETVGGSLVGLGYTRKPLPSVVLHNYGRLKGAGVTDYYASLIAKRMAATPGDPVSMYYMALQLDAEGKLAESESMYSSSLALDKRDFSVYGLAHVRHRLGKHMEAEAGYVEFLRMRPEESTAWLGLFSTCMLQDSQDKLDYYVQWCERSGYVSNHLLKFVAYCSEKMGNTALRDYYIGKYDATIT